MADAGRAGFAAALAAMAIVIAASCSPVRAADPAAVAAIANYRAGDRQAMLEAGARQEGSLLVYTVGAQIDPVTKAFAARYPFLTVKTFKNDVPMLLAKLFEEYKAGVYNADAFELEDYGLGILLDAKLLAPFTSPETANYGKDAIEPGPALGADAGGLCIARLQHRSLSARSGAAHARGPARSEVERKARRFGHRVHARELGGRHADEPGRGFRASARAPEHEALQHGRTGRRQSGRVRRGAAGGEQPLLAHVREPPGRRQGGVARARADLYGGERVALPVRSQHPHAAMLFVDFMLSSEAQTIYVEQLGYSSLRTEMASAAAPARSSISGCVRTTSATMKAGDGSPIRYSRAGDRMMRRARLHTDRGII